MITRIREVRRARGMTLDDVAQACEPPTTPQTIGRLETGTRTVSIGWLNRIAEALGVEAADLVDGGGGDKAELPVIAVLGVQGAGAPRRTAVVVAPRPKPGQVAITVLASNGDYRAGDEIWCDGGAGRVRLGAQPRRTSATACRSLPVRPPDRPRWRAPTASPAWSRRPPADRRQSALDRRRDPTGAGALTPIVVSPRRREPSFSFWAGSPPSRG